MPMPMRMRPGARNRARKAAYATDGSALRDLHV